MKRLLLLIGVAAMLGLGAEAEAEAAPAPQPAVPEIDEPTDADADGDGEDGGEVIEVIGSATPGSEHTVGAAELRRFERDDIHQVLTAVPGVYVREEDGLGLRPNIGMRGAGSERSAKIALLEDGVLIAPAPYAAPAAYYFPLLTRIERIDVLKGPAAIQHGPNTVGGSIDLISKPLPAERESTVDVAGGMNRYGKLHLSHAEVGEHLGAMIEGITLHNGGFKQLDGGGPTGFDKNELQLTLHANTARSARGLHTVELKLGYGDELSHETYTGLSPEDFTANPYRRYAATQLDRMKWNHQRALLTHRFEWDGKLTVTSQVYHQRFARVWRKLNGFDNRQPLEDVLKSPQGNNAVFYSILRGESDSTTADEMLLIGKNDRHFFSQGVQSTVRAETRAFGLPHTLSGGVRLHRDRADRRHSEEPHRMMQGQLVPEPVDPRFTRDAVAEALALAVYARDEVQLGPVRLSGGLRGEVIGSEWNDRQDPTRNNTDTHTVLIPGAGIYYQALPWAALLAGVHKGFVPGAPSPSGTAAPEESVNYEAGFRLGASSARAEVIGFFNDYSNIKGTCTFSSGCMEDRVDDEFSGGAVHVYGTEAAAEAELFADRAVKMPLRVSYTLTQSSFRSSFRSDNPQWGSVRKGFELPYLPEHQGSAEIGARHERWELAVAGRYIGAMRDVAGDGELRPGEHVPAYALVDLAGHARFGAWGELYATVTNLFDDEHIVSLRPFGARPGAPRMMTLGYKNDF